jgi:hypothetical protein
VADARHSNARTNRHSVFEVHWYQELGESITYKCVSERTIYECFIPPPCEITQTTKAGLSSDPEVHIYEPS